VHSSVDVEQALEDKSAVDIEHDHTSSAHLDLFGRDLGERAITEMWNRPMELEILEPIANAFRHRVPLFANRLRQVCGSAACRGRGPSCVARSRSSGPPIHSWRSLLGRRHHRVLRSTSEESRESALNPIRPTCCDGSKLLRDALAPGLDARSHVFITKSCDESARKGIPRRRKPQSWH
jgi:hypothetical protein